MKKISLLFLGFLISSVSAQKIIKVKRATRYSIHVWCDNFEGVIFKKNYKQETSDDKKNQSFTPTIDEIEFAERFLNQNLDTVKHISREKNIIQADLKKYVRQYCGFINKNGEKIIFINAFMDSNIYQRKKEWLKEIISVWDGGYRFWQIKVDLVNRKLFDFYVNWV